MNDNDDHGDDDVDDFIVVCKSAGRERERENSSDSTAILVYRVCIHVTLWPHQHKYAEMIYIQIFNFNLCPLSVGVCVVCLLFLYTQ